MSWHFFRQGWVPVTATMAVALETKEGLNRAGCGLREAAIGWKCAGSLGTAGVSTHGGHALASSGLSWGCLWSTAGEPVFTDEFYAKELYVKWERKASVVRWGHSFPTSCVKYCVCLTSGFIQDLWCCSCFLYALRGGRDISWSAENWKKKKGPLPRPYFYTGRFLRWMGKFLRAKWIVSVIWFCWPKQYSYSK